MLNDGFKNGQNRSVHQHINQLLKKKKPATKSAVDLAIVRRNGIVKNEMKRSRRRDRDISEKRMLDDKALLAILIIFVFHSHSTFISIGFDVSL